MAGAGHNGQLKAIVERIERLEEQKAEVQSDLPLGQAAIEKATAA